MAPLYQHPQQCTCPRPWRYNPVSSRSSNFDIVNDCDDEAHSAPKYRDASIPTPAPANHEPVSGRAADGRDGYHPEAWLNHLEGCWLPVDRTLGPHAACRSAWLMLVLFILSRLRGGSSMGVSGTSLADGLDRRCRCHQPPYSGRAYPLSRVHALAKRRGSGETEPRIRILRSLRPFRVADPVADPDPGPRRTQ